MFYVFAPGKKKNQISRKETKTLHFLVKQNNESTVTIVFAEDELHAFCGFTH